jgi:uncharacterized protein (DUF488 family)
MTIYTIGYEGIDIKDFLSLLHKHQVETLVDVRELPLSRKPGFSKNTLANTLNLSGLEYIHLPALGCPKQIRNRYRADGNWAQYKVGFLKYLQTQTEALGDLAALAGISKCALVCFEADYNFCHRSMVADAVKQLGDIDVVHIQCATSKKATSASHVPAYA